MREDACREIYLDMFSRGWKSAPAQALENRGLRRLPQRNQEPARGAPSQLVRSRRARFTLRLEAAPGPTCSNSIVT